MESIYTNKYNKKLNRILLYKQIDYKLKFIFDNV